MSSRWTKSIPTSTRRARKALLLFSQGYPIDDFRIVDYKGVGPDTSQGEDLHESITEPRTETSRLPDRIAAAS